MYEQVKVASGVEEASNYGNSMIKVDMVLGDKDSQISKEQEKATTFAPGTITKKKEKVGTKDSKWSYTQEKDMGGSEVSHKPQPHSVIFEFQIKVLPVNEEGKEVSVLELVVTALGAAFDLLQNIDPSACYKATMEGLPLSLLLS